LIGGVEFSMSSSNEWSSEGRNIMSPDRLSAIRDVLETVGPVVVEHWFYYGSRSPDRLVFEDYHELLEYLKANARPGDAFHVWNFAEVCRNDNTLANGKYPDAEGRVPKGGSY
jgi:hypothetical protein